MRAMVLCAGLGTRLRPLASELPKPLVPVLDRPLVGYTLAHLARAGVTEVVANAHHLPELLERGFVAEAGLHGLRATVLREPVLLGTGGGIRNALGVLGGEPF